MDHTSALQSTINSVPQCDCHQGERAIFAPARPQQNVARLSIEILAEIFSYFVPRPCTLSSPSWHPVLFCGPVSQWETDSADWSYILPMLRVCRTWLYAATNCAMLWRHVHLYRAPPLLVRRYLSYSREALIDVSFDLRDVVRRSGYLDLTALNDHACRIRSICICITMGAEPSSDDMMYRRMAGYEISRQLVANAHELRQIHIGGHQMSEINIDNELDTVPVLFGGHHPKLQHLFLENHLSIGRPARYANLTQLYIGPSANNRLKMMEIVDLLSINPKLQVVRLIRAMGTTQNVEFATLLLDNRHICLNHLRLLWLADDPEIVQALLSCLSLPQTALCRVSSLIRVSSGRRTEAAVQTVMPAETVHLPMLTTITALTIDIQNNSTHTSTFIGHTKGTDGNNIPNKGAHCGPWKGVFCLELGHSEIEPSAMPDRSAGLQSSMEAAASPVCFPLVQIDRLIVLEAGRLTPSVWSSLLSKLSSLTALRLCDGRSSLLPLEECTQALNSLRNDGPLDLLCPKLETLLINLHRTVFTTADWETLHSFLLKRVVYGKPLKSVLITTRCGEGDVDNELENIRPLVSKIEHLRVARYWEWEDEHYDFPRISADYTNDYWPLHD